MNSKDPNHSSCFSAIRSKCLYKYFPNLSYGETRSTLNAVLGSIEAYINNIHLNNGCLHQNIDEYFDKGCNFIKKLRDELNPLADESSRYHSWISREVLKSKKIITNSEDCSEWISYHTVKRKYINSADLIKGMNDSSYYWPIPDLESISNEYLNAEYLQCVEVDLIIIRSLIQSAYQNYIIGLYQARFPLKGIFDIRVPSESYEKQVKRKEIFIAVRNSIHSWISIILGVAASTMTQWWVGPLVWLAMQNFFSARSYFKHWQQEDKFSKIEENISRVARVVDDAYNVFISPTYLRERMKSVEDDYIFFPPLAYLILDRAMERDGLRWNTKDSDLF